MKNKNQFRQGDVLIERCQKLAPGKDASTNGRIILAHGEATGHNHELIDDPRAVLIEPDDAAAISSLLLSVKSDNAKVTHPDHMPPIPLERGNYRVIRQMEYSPKSPKRVAD